MSFKTEGEIKDIFSDKQKQTTISRHTKGILKGAYRRKLCQTEAWEEGIKSKEKGRHMGDLNKTITTMSCAV